MNSCRRTHRATYGTSAPETVADCRRIYGTSAPETVADCRRILTSRASWQMANGSQKNCMQQSMADVPRMPYLARRRVRCCVP